MDDFEKDFYGTSGAPSGQPAAAPPAASTVDEFDRDFYGPQAARPPAKPDDRKPAATTPPATTPARVPSRYQQARTPPKKPEPELTLAEASRQALTNLPSSAAGVLRTTATAFLNPMQTIEGLKQIGRGALSKAKGTVGVEQSAEEKRRDEAVLDAVLNQYKQTYGSEQGFLRALAQDPASIAMDFSTLLTGGAGALGKTGVIGEKAASTAAKAASFLDPVQVAVKTAKTVTSPVPKALALTAAITTGKSTENIKRAAQVAMDGTESQKSAFLRHSSADADQREILDAAEDALQRAKEKRSTEYRQQLSQARTAMPQFDYNSTINTLSKLEADNSTLLSSGQRYPKRRATADALREIADEVLVYASEPAGSVARGLDGADALKRRIGEIQAKYRGDPDAYRVATEAYNSVVNDIKQRSPDYAKAMEAYEDASKLISEARLTMGVGNRRLSDETVLKRLLNQKTAQKKKVVEELSEFNPDLPFMIAGSELRDFLPGGPQQILGGSLAALQYSLVHPLAPIAQIVASSPKIAGRAAYGVGKVGAGLRAATSPAVTIPGYYAGRVGEEVAGGVPPPAPEKPEFEEYFGPVVPPEGEVAPEVIEQIRGVEGTEQNPRSTAVGPFQFIDSTYREMLRKYAPEIASGMSDREIDEFKRTPDGMAVAEKLGAIYANENSDKLRSAGIEPTPGNIYLAHFLGPTGAIEALSADPSASAEQIVGRAAADANPEVIKGKTIGELISWAESKMMPRVARRSGGRVDHVDHLVNDLMARVKQAKKDVDKTTEPLLNQSDESIAKALDVAQQAI